MAKLTEAHLPETVEACAHCKGAGEYEQRYIESLCFDPCFACKGAQWIYRDSREPVPESVRNQIAVRNRLAPAGFVLGGRYRLFEAASRKALEDGNG